MGKDRHLNSNSEQFITNKHPAILPHPNINRNESSVSGITERTPVKGMSITKQRTWEGEVVNL